MDDAQFAELAGWIANVGLAGENEPEMVSGSVSAQSRSVCR